MHRLRPLQQLLLVLDPVRGISIAPTIDRPPQRLICMPDLVANRVTWSGFLLVSAWLPSPPLRPPRGAPRGRGAERQRSDSGRGAAHGGRCCVLRKPPLGCPSGRATKPVRRWPPHNKARWPPCSKARWQPRPKPVGALEGSLAAPPKARWPPHNKARGGPAPWPATPRHRAQPLANLAKIAACRTRQTAHHRQPPRLA